MWHYVVLFLLACVNPFGGMFVAMPLGLFKLEWPVWLVCSIGIPLGYVQVIVVDLLWARLEAWPWWMAMIEKRRNPKLTALLARKDATLWLAIFGVWAGPWLVAALTRYSGLPVKRVALPLLFGISYLAVGTALVCTYAPAFLPK